MVVLIVLSLSVKFFVLFAPYVFIFLVKFW